MEIGIVQWFKEHHDPNYVKGAINKIKKLGFKKVRTNISWHEWHSSPKNRERISQNLKRLAEAELDILPMLSYTPHELGVRPQTNVPPRNPELYGEFILDVLREIGGYFNCVQLWNEPNMATDWDPELDPKGEEFVKLIKCGSVAARQAGKKAVLGAFTCRGIDWFKKIARQGIMDHVDVISVHGLRGTWSEKVAPSAWENRVKPILDIVELYSDTYMPIWITECGYPTICLRKDIRNIPSEFFEVIQVVVFADLIRLVQMKRIEQAYFYTLYDTSPEFEPSLWKQLKNWDDLFQYAHGVIRKDGSPKLLGLLLMEGGQEAVKNFVEKHKIFGLIDFSCDRGEAY